MSSERVGAHAEGMKIHEIPAGSVVVGVDGSEHSEQALVWAADLAARESFRQTVKRLAVTYGWIGLYALYDFFNDNSRTRNSFSDASYFVGLLLVMTGIFFVRSKLARRSMLKQPPRVWISHDRIVIGNKLLKIEETDRSTWQVHADAKGEPLLRLQTNLKSAPLLFAPVTSADAARLASAAQQVLVTS